MGKRGIELMAERSIASLLEGFVGEGGCVKILLGGKCSAAVKMSCNSREVSERHS